MLHSAALCCNLLHSAAFCCIPLHSAVISCIPLHSAAFRCIPLHSASFLLRSAAFCFISAAFCYVLLLSAAFCCIVLHSATFCFILLYLIAFCSPLLKFLLRTLLYFFTTNKSLFYGRLEVHVHISATITAANKPPTYHHRYTTPEYTYFPLLPFFNTFDANDLNSFCVRIPAY
jgi:hypothetical protein